MKLNKKGFVLAETLVVAVFMATIFTIIYVNFYPLIGEYEKRENYDDLDSKYDIYWFKRLVQNKNALPTYKWSSYTGAEYSTLDDNDEDGYPDSDNTCNASTCRIKTNQYVELNCSVFESTGEINYEAICNELQTNTGLRKLYLTTYYLAATNSKQQPVYKDQTTYFFKNEVKASSNFDENFKDYVNYLPDYRFPSPNGARFRLLAQFERYTIPGNPDTRYYTYATIEVNREKGV